MPQLDKITFLSQFFWLSFFYLGFYFLIYKYFLPKMSRTLKFRKRRMNTSQDGTLNMEEESHKVASSYQTLLSTGLNTCKSVFNQNFKGAEDWLNNTVSQANQTKYKNTNVLYISSLGERSISQRLVISQAFADLSEKSRFALLISKLAFLKKENYSTLVGPSVTNQGFVSNHNQKGHKAEKRELKSNIVEKQESSSKNKSRPTKEVDQVVGKDSSPKDKNSRTVSPKSSTSKNSKSKTSKKK
jgi:hypothetical protein